MNKPITPAEMKAYVDATWERCLAEAWIEKPLAMQVRPSEFAQIIKGKEKVTGIPAYWAEWPSKEQP